MKYALLIYGNPGQLAAEPAPEPPPMEAWLDYTTALKEAGVVLAAEQLRAVDTATTVRRDGGERLLTDGPFAETKEHLLGFFLLDVPDLDAALEWAARLPIHPRGTVEVRPVAEGGAWRAPLE
jgi:hypothetical protein